MKRSIITVPSLVAAVLSVGSPASAAQAPDLTAFETSTYRCTSDAAGSTCVSTWLRADEGSDGSGGVLLSVETTREVDGGTVDSTWGSGFASTRGLSVDRSLNVTLPPTAMTFQTCGASGCHERELVVAAAHPAASAVTVTRNKSTSRDGNCTTTTTVESHHAGTAGSFTLDGATYDGFGSARTEDQRSTSRCK